MSLDLEQRVKRLEERMGITPAAPAADGDAPVQHDRVIAHGYAVVRRYTNRPDEIKMVTLTEPHAAGSVRKDNGEAVVHCSIVLGADVDYKTFGVKAPDLPEAHSRR